MASRGGYIYCLFAPEFNAAYVGQTVSALGPLGRLSQHLGQGPGATFRHRLEAIFGYDEVDIGPVACKAIRLPDRSTFLSTASDYREAVEAIAQYGLIEDLRTHGIRVVVVSRVMLNPLTRLAYVDLQGQRIRRAFLTWLQTGGPPSAL